MSESIKKPFLTVKLPVIIHLFGFVYTSVEEISVRFEKMESPSKHGKNASGKKE